MPIVDKLAEQLTKKPFWPYGFVGLNAIFALLAVASILVLAHDQKLAVQSALLQERNFARYRADFDRATNVKVKLLEIIAKRLNIPDSEISQIESDPFLSNNPDKR